MFLPLVCLVFISTMPDPGHAWWPAWRGPQQNGVAENATLPVTWSDEKNIAWKRAIPGLGLATPVIWGEQLFVLTAAQTDKKADKPVDASKAKAFFNPKGTDRVHQYLVISLDRKTGKELWRDVAIEKVPHETTHGDASWASISPVTDGTHLVASFGSAGIVCYTLTGKRLWDVDLGDMRTRNGFGEGSSPVIYGDTVVVNWDHEDTSFIVALDLASGKERWRRDRDEPTSWATPVVATVEGRTQIIVSATNRIRAYDLASGEVIWETGGMTLNAIPTPNLAGNTLFAASGFRGNALLAINLVGAKGDLAGSSNILWEVGRDTPYVPSTLLYENNLYMLKHNRGIISCLDSKTGKLHYGPERLKKIEGVYASPVAAGGHLYVVGRRGHTVVLKAGNELKVVATNRLSDHFDASPAIAGNALYLRGHENLYCIGTP